LQPPPESTPAASPGSDESADDELIYKRRDGVVRRLWTTTQAYRYSGITSKDLRSLAKEGKILHKYRNGRYYFRREWLDEYLASDEPVAEKIRKFRADEV
jgi:hypothetical protein